MIKENYGNGVNYTSWYIFSFVIVYKLRTNNWYQGNYRNTANVQEDILTMEELKEALKNGKSLGEHNLYFELHKYAGGSFHDRILNFLK
jgi:hypothetical protein